MAKSKEQGRKKKQKKKGRKAEESSSSENAAHDEPAATSLHLLATCLDVENVDEWLPVRAVGELLEKYRDLSNSSLDDSGSCVPATTHNDKRVHSDFAALRFAQLDWGNKEEWLAGKEWLLRSRDIRLVVVRKTNAKGKVFARIASILHLCQTRNIACLPFPAPMEDHLPCDDDRGMVVCAAFMYVHPEDEELLNHLRFIGRTITPLRTRIKGDAMSTIHVKGLADKASGGRKFPGEDETESWKAACCSPSEESSVLELMRKYREPGVRKNAIHSGADRVLDDVRNERAVLVLFAANVKPFEKMMFLILDECQSREIPYLFFEDYKTFKTITNIEPSMAICVTKVSPLDEAEFNFVKNLAAAKAIPRRPIQEESGPNEESALEKAHRGASTAETENEEEINEQRLSKPTNGEATTATAAGPGHEEGGLHSAAATVVACTEEEEEAIFNLLQKYEATSDSEEGPVVLGVEPVAKAVQKKRALLVLLAADVGSDANDPSLLALACREKSVPYLFLKNAASTSGVDEVPPSTTALCLTKIGEDDEEELRKLIVLANRRNRRTPSSGVGNLDAGGRHEPNGLPRAEGERNPLPSNTTGHTTVGSDGDDKHQGTGINKSQVDMLASEGACTSRGAVSIQILERGSSVTDSPGMEIVRAEEEIAALEASLQWITSRKETTEEELSDARSAYKQLQGKLETVQSHRGQLKETQARQESLLAELRESLEKSRGQLKRLATPDASLSVEELAQLAAEEDNTDGINSEDSGDAVDAVHPSTQRDLDEDETVSKVGTSRKDAARMLDGQAHRYTVRTEESSSRGLLVLQRRLRLDPQSRLAPLLPYLDSKRLIQAILDVGALEIRELDDEQPVGNHRSEAVLNTCLDGRLMAPRKPSDRKKKTMSLESEDTGIDPNVPLCPYEMSGVCADPYCSYQHLEARPHGRVLPREYLPLPSLNVFRDQSSSVTPGRNEGAEQPSRKRKRQELDNIESDETHYAGAETKPGKSTAEKGLASNMDFISLPEESFLGEDETSLSTDDDSHEDTQNDVVRPSFRALWWQPCNQDDALGQLPPEVSISVLVGALGNHFIGQKDEAQVRQGDSLPSMAEACSVLGGLSDVAALSIHAGRSDVLQTVRQMANERLLHNAFANVIEEEHEEKNGLDMVSQFCDIAKRVRQLLDKIEASHYLTQTENQFLAGFDAQVSVSIVSHFVEQLGLFLRTQSDSLSSLSLVSWQRELTALSAALDAEVSKPRKELLVKDLAKPNFFLLGSEEMEARDSSSRATSGETEKTEWDSRKYRCKAQSLRNDLWRGKGLMASLIDYEIPCSRSIRFYTEEVLQPSWSSANRVLQSALEGESPASAQILSVCVLIGYTVLGVLGKAAVQLDSATAKGNNRPELSELYSEIDRILRSLRRAVGSMPIVGALLSPLFAANIAFACSLKLYDKAQHRLESLLGGDAQVSGVNIARQSEFLWSQLIQLRLSLPLHSQKPADAGPKNHKSSRWDLPADIVESHRLLSSRIAELEVYPRRVVLKSDASLVNAMVERKETTEPTNEGILENKNFVELQRLVELVLGGFDGHSGNDCSFSIEGIPFTFPTTVETPSLLRSALPGTILIAGPALKTLSLKSCRLANLPRHFGSPAFFPSLVVLELSNNCLVTLPESISMLSRLERLSIQSNRICSLPPTFALPRLTSFDASHNMISEIPTSMSACKHLVSLNFEGNPIDLSFWSVAAQLPNLRELLPSP